MLGRFENVFFLMSMKLGINSGTRREWHRRALRNWGVVHLEVSDEQGDQCSLLGQNGRPNGTCPAEVGEKQDPLASGVFRPRQCPAERTTSSPVSWLRSLAQPRGESRKQRFTDELSVWQTSTHSGSLHTKCRGERRDCRERKAALATWLEESPSPGVCTQLQNTP